MVTNAQSLDFSIYTLVASNALETIRSEALLDVALFTHAGSLDMTFNPCETEWCHSDQLVGVLKNGNLVVVRARSEEGRLGRFAELLGPEGQFRRRLVPAGMGSDPVFFAEQSDRRFVLVVEGKMVRFGSDGEVDPEFEQTEVGVIRALASSPSNHLYVAGYFPRAGVRRIKPHGEGDTGFEVDLSGGQHAIPHTIAVEEDEQIVVGGLGFIVGEIGPTPVVRLNSDGTLDSSFRPELGGAFSRVYTIQIQPDQRILVGGELAMPGHSAEVNLVLLTGEGLLDASFQLAHFQRSPTSPGFVNVLGIQSDGRILAAGVFTSVNGVERNRLARFHTDGTLDLSFEPSGGTHSLIRRLGLQKDDYLVIGEGALIQINGISWRGLARLHLRDFDPPKELALPKLFDFQLQAHNLLFSFRTASSRRYSLEHTEQLENANWTPFSVLEGHGFVQTVTIPLDAGFTTFVRVRTEPR
jgi:uncharacterized delta-60 repeat protein